MRNLPPPIIAAMLSFSAVVMALTGTMVHRGRPHIEAPSWSSTAVVGLAIYSAFVSVYMLFMRKQLAGKMGERFRAHGNDPKVFLGFAGTVMFFSPTAVALFLVLAGIPLAYLCLTAAFSIVAMIVWSAGYRSYGR